jgi:hypothetical protein
MNRKAFFPLLSVLAALSLLACPTEPEPEEEYGAEAVITAIDGQAPVYFSFDLGATVDAADAETTGWDLAFSYNRLIHTNSGDTAAALPSGGQGGVWAADTTDLSANISPAAADFSGPYNTDKSRWTNPAAEMGDATLNQLNVITYIGYGSGTGTGDSKDSPLTDYKYNAKQYYHANLSTMPPVYSVTRQVYIVRHGDGLHYSKMHIIALESLPSTSGAKRIYAMRYENF